MVRRRRGVGGSGDEEGDGSGTVIGEDESSFGSEEGWHPHPAGVIGDGEQGQQSGIRTRDNRG